MREIYQYDATYRLYFQEHFVVNKAILEAAHDFWWKKYIKYLGIMKVSRNRWAIKYILEVQEGFFDTLMQISPESFF